MAVPGANTDIKAYRENLFTARYSSPSIRYVMHSQFVNEPDSLTLWHRSHFGMPAKALTLDKAFDREERHLKMDLALALVNGLVALVCVSLLALILGLRKAWLKKHRNNSCTH